MPMQRPENSNVLEQSPELWYCKETHFQMSNEIHLRCIEVAEEISKTGQIQLKLTTWLFDLIELTL